MVRSWLDKLLGKPPLPPFADDPAIEQRLRDLGLRDPVFARAVALQMHYWQPSASTATWVFDREASQLTWLQRLHQHHRIACTYLALQRPEFWSWTASIATDLAATRAAFARSSAELLQPESPYRGRHGYVWRGIAPPSEGEPLPDEAGFLRNRAATHLGALEIIRLNAAQEPMSIDFVAYSAIETLAILPETVFAAGLLVQDGQKTPILLPTRHGLSWWTKDPTLALLPRAQPIIDAQGQEPSPTARDALWIGLQELVCDADQVERGSLTVGLHSTYQISWDDGGCGSSAPPPGKPLAQLRL